MELKRFNQKDIIFALDIGTRSIIGTVGIIKDKKFQVVCEKYLEHEERAMVDGQIHDITLVASVVQKVKSYLEEELQIQLNEVSIAAAGRFLRTIDVKTELELNEDEEVNKEIVRGLELSAVKKAEEEISAVTEGKLYCVGYSVKNYYLNGFLISNLIGHKGENIGAEAIATFLPRSVIDSLYAVMNRVNLKVVNLTLEPIAAMEAAIPKNLRLLNIALVDIGAGTSDIAISSKESISAYGMVPMAGDEVTETIVQEYLVDFNTAENIKRSIVNEKEVTYIDVLGMENTVLSENVFKLINSIVTKTADEISKKTLELNGGKAPSAVFLVGGGAHTPGILEAISEKLNLPPQRIAIKDRQAVIECISDNKLGSAGVTVLGIALTALRSMGNDFIDVILNNDVISLFNSHKHTIMDVLLQAGINPSLLISKNGKSARFNYNGCKRIVFGEYGTNAKITINGEEATLETEVKANDNINLEYAQNGRDAAPKLSEHIRNINSIAINLGDEIINIDPIILVNEKPETINYIIKNNDDIRVFLPTKVSEFKKYVLKEKVNLIKDDMPLEDDYELIEGDYIIKEVVEVDEIETVQENIVNDDKEFDGFEEEATIELDKEVIDSSSKKEPAIINDGFHSITVTINGENKILMGKSEYVIVDIFDYIDFNLTIAQGIINLTLNGEKAAYTAKLKEGDVVEVFWSKN
ncbi:cell division protein FtsA [Clostridium saccharoperbutylacetonicum]|uniref:Actin-like ATPase involved in cell division n=1 Tax=Clostridium saccharoperbutylacetonicum N1-4(HMT) TaxID=931276 RepID=M1MG67_9CLOT|nr:cell division protein FtsA [Clostridium saccharoperbutylacetonicum]AGF55333.1 actin-like ATPase involved in cell division [Clostridium saccharoperbutylacetonicum N1-4(HMT)]NRT63954.1 cell division protein FtsA [Clostridium saccharoperbutylacetonicum]NSB27321.1 cell division protein FtsA [Clostridium saccharoperbutylacetonicum]NSB40810.1 cell division protein FtsA [Clostridium saccharoperbutylacetonicum]